MADLMKDSFTYSDLANKYGNFRVPAAKIKIDDADPFESTKTCMEDLTVSLSLESASSVSFKIINGYDKEGRTFKSNVKSTFCLGKIITIELGYVSNLTLVFKGFISAVNVEFSDEPYLQVTALDVRRLMMQEKHVRSFDGLVKHSELFDEVISTYSELCTPETEATTDEIKPIDQNDNDYNYIQRNLLVNREFFVFADKAYYRKPASEATPVIEFEWGENLLSFSRRSCYLNLKVNVCGYDSVTQEAFNDEVEIKNDDQQNSATSEKQSHYTTSTSVKSKEDAKKRAEEIAKKKKSKSQSGSGTCIGLPEIVPGRFVKINKLDDDLSSDYYIVSVNHSFGSGGFNTSFELGNGTDLYNELLDNEPKEEEEKGSRINSVTTALVKENWNEEHKGMVKVEFFLGEEGKSTTEWVPVCTSYGGSSYGIYTLPEVGSEVVTVFNMGDKNSPIVVGNLWNDKNTLPENVTNENNSIKCIKTKGGSEIIFDDEEGKEKIQINTKGGLKISFEDEKKIISVADKEQSNSIKIDIENGKITTDAKKKIILSLGGTASVTLDGDSKTTTVKSDNVKLEASQALTLKGQSVKLEGSMVEIKASGSLKLESSAIAEVKGTPVKIN